MNFKDYGVFTRISPLFDCLLAFMPTFLRFFVIVYSRIVSDPIEIENQSGRRTARCDWASSLVGLNLASILRSIRLPPSSLPSYNLFHISPLCVLEIGELRPVPMPDMSRNLQAQLIGIQTFQLLSDLIADRKQTDPFAPVTVVMPSQYAGVVLETPVYRGSQTRVHFWRG